MAKYKFEYDDIEVSRKITHEIEINGDLLDVLEEVNTFLKAITHQSYSLISVKNEEEETAVEEFLENYRRSRNGK
jgi:hypothetical protein